MATPSDKLAQSLEALKALQDQSIVAICTKNMMRTHRERLLKNGFIKEVMKAGISIGRLYRIEREIKNLSTQERWKIRQQKSQPIIDDLRTC